MAIDLHNINPLNGSRDNAFEELCAQLARAESSEYTLFVRKGTPDAGVECYAVFPDESEWAWQAKNFDSLGNSQWSQINDSVRTAIEKHPKLIRYYVCVPLDRPDSREQRTNKKGQRKKIKSAYDNWLENKEKWEQFSRMRGMEVEFIYWGASEILERLSRSEHLGRREFWFGELGFDQNWFAKRFEEAVSAAGPRYTPELHLDLPIAQEFETFGRTAVSLQALKAHAEPLREIFNQVKPRYEVIIRWLEESPEHHALARDSWKNFCNCLDEVLVEFSSIQLKPAGSITWQPLVEAIQKAIEEISTIIKCIHACDHKNFGKVYKNESIPRISAENFDLEDFRDLLADTEDSLVDALTVFNNNLFLLTGNAGTGKTHLLCDLTRRRLDTRQPTVLLMGQRFGDDTPPWLEVLQQLHIQGSSAESFLGALETAAQAANCRAFLVIDALNEGGRKSWPRELQAFLATIRSEWIAVILAVRSPFPDTLLHDAKERAVHREHRGFGDQSYDALRSFFLHYQLEIPSVPILLPEFQNPLFLKLLCQGLRAKSERCLPKGSNGITTVFNWYLKDINTRLAGALNYDPRHDLVGKALKALVKELNPIQPSLLPESKAQELVNNLLPGRGYQDSLFKGMVSENVLIEVLIGEEYYVIIAYERLADHLAARDLLEFLHAPPSIVASTPTTLLDILNGGSDISLGLLEALYIQVPERIGRELNAIAPGASRLYGSDECFRQSLIWRDIYAVTKEAVDRFNEQFRSINYRTECVEILVNVAGVPGHPLNADYLHQTLLELAMPDRDSFWSTAISGPFFYNKSDSKIHRLLDWCSSEGAILVESNVAALYTKFIAWMFSSSNRFLRDDATIALANLLTNKVSVVEQLITDFIDVDDPYVVERVFAVSYSVSIKTIDRTALTSLAQLVYDRVFALGTPRPSILFRDYAHGIIERALYLGCLVQISGMDFHPPYCSSFPGFPTEDQIAHLHPDWTDVSHQNGELKWSADMIASSIFGGDFGRYVIGTNSASESRHWLALTLDDPYWIRPQTFSQKLDAWALVALTEIQRNALQEFSVAEACAKSRFFLSLLDIAENIIPRLSGYNDSNPTQKLVELKALLSPEQLIEFENLWADRNHPEAYPPRIRLRDIQNYILWRVFDLGWTIERFGRFDRFSVPAGGREAAKIERMGKKYQWIAYYEVLAYLSDHYQFFVDHVESNDPQKFHGAWQVGARDIDPTNTGERVHSKLQISAKSDWWIVPYVTWGSLDQTDKWLGELNDLPAPEKLLFSTDPQSGLGWINVDSYFVWSQEFPPDREKVNFKQREVWASYTGYLIHLSDVDAFMSWAETMNFWGDWMPRSPEIHEVFLGEHGWSAAFQCSEAERSAWITPERGCPAKLCAIALRYPGHISGFDCSNPEGPFDFPAPMLIEHLNLTWIGRGRYESVDNGLAAQSVMTGHPRSSQGLLLREDLLQRFTEETGMTVCWTVIGQKRIYAPNHVVRGTEAQSSFSGAFSLTASGLKGSIRNVEQST